MNGVSSCVARAMAASAIEKTLCFVQRVVQRFSRAIKGRQPLVVQRIRWRSQTPVGPRARVHPPPVAASHWPQWAAATKGQPPARPTTQLFARPPSVHDAACHMLRANHLTSISTSFHPVQSKLFQAFTDLFPILLQSWCCLFDKHHSWNYLFLPLFTSLATSNYLCLSMTENVRFVAKFNHVRNITVFPIFFTGCRNVLLSWRCMRLGCCIPKYCLLGHYPFGLIFFSFISLSYQVPVLNLTAPLVFLNRTRNTMEVCCSFRVQSLLTVSRS